MDTKLKGFWESDDAFTREEFEEAKVANIPATYDAGFVKYDGHKPRPELLPPRALLEISDVLAYGAVKYSDNNWRKCADLGRYRGALLRHLLAYLAGERLDDESRKRHLAHAGCCLLYLLELEE